MEIILHIIHINDWAVALMRGQYSGNTLESEGFIHCSTPQQVLIPANAMFRGQTDLMLLCIDPALVQARLVYEDCYDSGMAFPHIYGPLNLNAVRAAIPFPPNEDGTFSLPPLP
jgi:uncharacterized protein (DUF952 family)